MPIEQELRNQLTAAMKAKDLRTADVIRMINTKVMERRTAKGFSGQVDDALHLDVIAAYKKQLQKAREEFLAVGEKGKEQADQLQWEVEFCDRFLPKGLDEDELRAAVRAAIEATGAKDPKMAGRVVGEVMKQHKGRVDAAAVKKVVDEELART
ncbi:MAG: GatB/YqeY domain-containing protein [Deltaproteobacteria bacterium]|nr:GatB/YqeY domain-containing protein [Deltaproteobacteria bacterium]